ncbi:MAG: flippase-like domain-containing protein [Verrucomicrobia bacterium]|nr:flippase-like domain-containing protein [Verrucomicrobiota bacterium]
MAETPPDIAEPTPPRRTARRVLLVAVKLTVAVALLYVLLRDMQWSDFRDDLRGIRWPWFALAVFLHLPGYLISAYRWRLLLVAQGERISLRKLVESYIVATFFNCTLLGTLGGDVVRLRDTGLGRKRGAQAASSILVERLTGLITMVLLAAAGMGLLALTGGISTRFGVLVWGALGLFAVSCAGLVVLTHPRVARRLAALLGRLVPPGGRLGQKLADALEVFRTNRRPVYANLAWALLLQVNVAAHWFCLALALGVPAVRETPLQCAFAFMAIVPLITLVLMLPLTPGGAGVRELTLRQLRQGLGFAATHAGAASVVLMGWLQVVSVLAYGAAGFVIFIARSFRARRH